MELNFTFDEPTVNGRIYSKKILIAALDKFMEKSTRPIVRDASNVDNTGAVSIKDIIGFVESYYITSDNKIDFKVKFVDDLIGHHLRNIELSTFSIGHMKDNIICKPLLIKALYPVFNNEE